MYSIEQGTSFPITSADIEAEDVFTDNNKIIVYVEAFPDISFWTVAFQKAGISNVNVVEIGRDYSANGKNIIVSRIRSGDIQLGRKLFVALDSDHDYLLDKNNDIYSNEFCLQTYIYSIENYQYYPHDLLQYCKLASNYFSEHPDIKCFGEVMENWSKDNYKFFINFYGCAGTSMFIYIYLYFFINFIIFYNVYIFYRFL